MKIAYLLHTIHKPNTGFCKKIAAQTRRWVMNGTEVACFVLTDRDDGNGWERTFGRVPTHVRRYTHLFDSLRAARQVVLDILTWQPDLVYFRYALYYPAYGKLSRKVPVIVEINGDMGRQLLIRSKLRYWYYRLTHNGFMRHVSGLIFVTGELSRSPQYARFGKPSRVIANGIDLGEYPNILPAPTNNQPRLIFIGARWAPWKGIDKIFWLASHFPDWRFDLVGEHGDYDEVPSNVFLHDFMPRAEYEKLLAQADVALGSLALHRAGLYEASTLSAREYLAYGIPTIIGYDETDFPSPKDFLLQLPCTPENVREHVEDIKQFVQAMQGKRVPRESISHLDVTVKERERLAFFEEIVASRR
jgi:glycosyltransferase involved in cell wall biosynthesis